jgi:hypothetical protein
MASGLKRIALGFWCLCLAGLWGTVVFAPQVRQWLVSLRLSTSAREVVLTAACAAAGLLFTGAAMLGATGLWRTFRHSPLPRRGRMLLLASALCVVTAALALFLVLVLGGNLALAALSQALAEWWDSGNWEWVCLLHLMGIGLCVSSPYFFNHYLRLLSRMLGDSPGDLSGASFAAAWSALLGAAAGAVVCAYRLVTHPELLMLIPLSLLLCLLWLQVRLRQLWRTFALLGEPDKPRQELPAFALGEPDKSCREWADELGPARAEKSLPEQADAISVDEVPRRLSGVRRALRAINRSAL